MHADRAAVRGAAYIVASELALVSMAATIKHISVDLPNEMIVFFRNVFALLVMVPAMLHGGPSRFATRVPGLHLVRGLAGVTAMYCLFYAVAHLKLADAMMLKLTVPIFIPLIALVWLNERVYPMAWVAVGVGFVGVALILKPGGELHWVALVAVGGSVMAALAKVAVRKLSATEPALRIVFYFATVATVVSVVPLAWAWQTPTALQWLLLLSLGPQATVGQLLLTRGYGAAPASQVGVFTYSSVLFGAAYGFAFWGETMGVVSLAGAVLIATAGVLALRARTVRGSLQVS